MWVILLFESWYLEFVCIFEYDEFYGEVQFEFVFFYWVVVFNIVVVDVFYEFCCGKGDEVMWVFESGE